MKKIILTFLLILNFQLKAQVSNYSFDFMIGSYIENSSSATSIPEILTDDALSTVKNIGFNFEYDGRLVTQFKASSNGFITFDIDGNNPSPSNNLVSTNDRAFVAPLWDDLGASATSSATYEITGATPNRVLTIEWKNWKWNYNTSNPVISFQVKLYETSNLIEFVYQHEASDGNPTASGGASIGINSFNNNNTFNFLNVTSVISLTSSNLVLVNDITTRPYSGQIYKFTPPSASPLCANLVSPMNGESNVRSSTLSWNPPAYGSRLPKGYKLVVGTTSGDYNVLNRYDVGNVLTYTCRNLYPNTTYFAKVISYNDFGEAMGCSETSFTTGPNLYCVPSTTNGNLYGDTITNIQITGTSLNNTTSSASYCTLYNSAPNHKAILRAGDSYDLVVTIGSIAQGIAAWIDFNNDTVFDLSERIAFTNTTADAASSTTFNFLVPNSTAPGYKRMRIHNVYNVNGIDIDPCSLFQYGEVEDYEVLIPIENDECSNALTLNPGGVFDDNDVNGTNVFTSDSNVLNPICGNYLGKDVWYSVVIPPSGNLTIETGATGTPDGVSDTGLAVYSGICGSLNIIACDDDSGANAFSLINLTGRTPGERIYIRVWEYGGNLQGTFRLSAYDASLSSDDFDLSTLKVYPNPVTSVLNISDDNPFSKVEVYNALGQKVIDKAFKTTNTTLDLSMLNAGQYFLKVYSGNSVKTVKFIKV